MDPLTLKQVIEFAVAAMSNTQFLIIATVCITFYVQPYIKKHMIILNEYNKNVEKLDRIDKNTQNDENFIKVLTELQSNFDDTKKLLKDIADQIDKKVEQQLKSTNDINDNIKKVESYNVDIIDKNNYLKDTINELYNYIDRMNNKISIMFKMIDVGSTYVETRNGRKFDNIRSSK